MQLLLFSYSHFTDSCFLSSHSPAKTQHTLCVCVFADGILYTRHTRHIELKATDLGAHNSFLIPLFLLLLLPKQTLKGKGPGAVGQGETWLSRSSGRHSILCSIAKVGASASRDDDDDDGANACKHQTSPSDENPFRNSKSLSAFVLSCLSLCRDSNLQSLSHPALNCSSLSLSLSLLLNAMMCTRRAAFNDDLLTFLFGSSFAKKWRWRRCRRRGEQDVIKNSWYRAHTLVAFFYFFFFFFFLIRPIAFYTAHCAQFANSSQ